MKSLALLLTSVLMSFAGKIIMALGLSVISYTGFDFMQSRFINWFEQSLGSFPADALQIFYIAGGGVALNWFFGAFTFIVSLKSLSYLGTVFKS